MSTSADWTPWDGTDPKETVLVKTDDGAVAIATFQTKDIWTVFCPGIPMLFQPHLQGRVTHIQPIPA